MKRKRHSEEQIAFALRQAESGTPVSDIFRKWELPSKRFTGRRGGMPGSESVRFRLRW